MRNYTFMKLTGAAVIAGLWGMAPTHALAQSDCACLVQAAAPGQPSGAVTLVHGNVKVSGATGFHQAQTGSPLSAGSELMTGADGRVGLNVGGCHLNFGANSNVSLTRQGSKICVRGSNISASVPAPLPSPVVAHPYGALAIFGGTVATLSVVGAIGGGEHPASR